MKRHIAMHYLKHTVLHAVIFAVFLSILLLCSCSTKKHITATVATTDSVRIETHTEKITVLDTVYLTLPAQSAQNTTTDTISRLETDYSVSTARINNDGTLYHDLRTKPDKIPVPTEKEIVERDSTEYHGNSSTETEQVIKEVEVEKPLSWFQKTQIIGFWIVFVFVSIKNRKKLFTIFQRFV